VESSADPRVQRAGSSLGLRVESQSKNAPKLSASAGGDGDLCMRYIVLLCGNIRRTIDFNLEKRVTNVVLIAKTGAVHPLFPSHSHLYASSTLTELRRATRAYLPWRRRASPKGEKMAKEQRRGNREIRKPKAVKSAVAAPVLPFALKAPSAATTTEASQR